MFLADSQAQIDRMARRVHRRLRAAGATSLDLEDVVSELTVAWCIARDSYDPQYGTKFSTYLHRGMLNHVNTIVDREIGQRHMVGVFLDAEFGEDDGASLHDALPADIALPDELAIEASVRRLMRDTCSADTLAFVDLLENPSEEIVEALGAAQERASFARSRGLNAIAPKGVTAPLVFEFLDLSRTRRHAVYAELKALSEKVNQK